MKLLSTSRIFYVLVFSILTFNSLLYGQVGINTTSPGDGSILDIDSSTKGMLVPRVDIPDLDEIAPITGGTTQSLLVYNIGTTTTAGFYYWNVATTEWIALSPAEDGDFHKVGTSTAPTLITEDVFRTGKVGIGDTTPSYALEVRSDTEAAAVNFVKGGSVAGPNYGLQVTNFSSGIGEHVGVRSIVNYTVAGTDTDRHYGLFTRVRGLNPSSGVNTNQNIGVYNQLDFGAGDHIGTFNSMSGTQDSDNIGTSNFISNTGNGEHSAVRNTLTGAGNGDHMGVYNNINNSSGNNYGFRNEIDKTVVGKTSYGTYNSLFGNLGGTAIAGYFSATGSGTNYSGIFLNGNVGIGTTAPTEKLEVNGKIKATDINFSGLGNYVSDAAAGAAGLVTGDVYRNDGDLRIKL